MGQQFSNDISKEKLEHLMQDYYSALKAANSAADAIAHFENRGGKISKDFTDKFYVMHDMMDKIINMVKGRDYLIENGRLNESANMHVNDEFMKQFFKAQDDSDGDPKLFKKLVMKYTGLTPSGFKDEMAGPIGKTLLLKGKPARDYYIKDSNLKEEDILFLKKWAGILEESNEQQLRFSPDMVVGKKEWDNSGGETVHGMGESFTEEYKSKWKLSNGFMVDATFTIHIDPEYPEEHVELELNVVNSNHDDVAYAEIENIDADIQMASQQGGLKPDPNERDSEVLIDRINIGNLDNITFSNFHVESNYDEATIKKFILDLAKFVLNRI
jgi:hypothetical protein